MAKCRKTIECHHIDGVVKLKRDPISIALPQRMHAKNGSRKRLSQIKAAHTVTERDRRTWRTITHRSVERVPVPVSLLMC